MDDQAAKLRQERPEVARILDTAARFHQWWKDGEAKLKDRHETGEPAEKRAA